MSSLSPESSSPALSNPGATLSPSVPANGAVRWVLVGLAAAHLAFAYATELRWEHVAADGLLAGLALLNAKTLSFAVGLLPLWLTGIVVDSQRYLPLLGSIHTGDMWKLEVTLFHAPGDKLMSWAEWFSSHHHSVGDFFCGASYILYLYEFLGLIFFFLIRRRDRLGAVTWAFLLVNALGAVIYMICPVAPPWYIMDHGLGPAILNAAPSAAGCARFDALLHIHYFQGFYARNPNVFGAMPSLHVAYPLMVVLFTWQDGWKLRIPTFAFTVLVGFSAVYLGHHYVLDVLAGLAVGGLSFVAGKTIHSAAARPAQISPNSASTVEGA